MNWFRRKLPEPEGDLALMQALEAHLEPHYGPVAQVWHEKRSHMVHLDAHCIEPTPGVPKVVFTTGMSSKAMVVDEENAESPYVELLLYLDEDWPIEAKSAAWPVDVLLEVARYPHALETSVDSHHTIDFGNPFPGTAYSAVLLMTPIFLPEADHSFRHPDGREIRLLMVGMLHAEEAEHARENGTDELLDRFTEAGLLPADVFVLRATRTRPMR